MAYTKNTWETGDIVSSQKLNHIEDGIANAGSAFFINASDSENEEAFFTTLDKTWQEIYDAYSSGTLCVIRYSGDTFEDIYVVVAVKKRVYMNEDTTQTTELTVEISGWNNAYASDTPDGYPYIRIEKITPGDGR